MGCIQTKKLIKIDSSQINDAKNSNNNVVIHNIRKDTTSNDMSKVNKVNNNTCKEKEKNDKMIHINSNNFQSSIPINDSQSKSLNSKKNSSFSNQSESNSKESSEIFKLTINNNDLINKDSKFLDKYEIIEEVNLDSYFQTYKIKLKDDKLSKEVFRSMIKILKELFGQFANDKKIAEEVSLLSKLDSSYIIKVYECFISNNKYYLITDYCQHGSLYQKLKNGNIYNENQIRYLVLQIFKSINYLNMNNYLHIELSPEKILIDNIIQDENNDDLYDIKLLDFFCPSKNNFIYDNNSPFFCYMAPEVVEQKYSSTCDIWSIGIILFEMFFGKLPYKDNDDYQEYIKNIKSTYNISNNISNEFKDLLDKMLDNNPSTRITINECLSHHWVLKENTKDITDEDEEINNNSELKGTKTDKLKLDKNKKKSDKNKIIKMENKKMLNNSENNSYNNANLMRISLERNSNNISDSINNNENNFDIINKNKNDLTATYINKSKLNNSTAGKIKVNRLKIKSNNNLNNNIVKMKNNLFNKNENKDNFKSELIPKNIKTSRKKQSIKRLSTISAFKIHDNKNQIKFHPLIDRTINYIKFYINLNFMKNREKERITKIFHKFDNKKNGYLLFDKVYLASINYRDNKRISIENLINLDIKKFNNDKKYYLNDFIDILIDEKTKYINNNFKNVFESIIHPNINEIIKIYKEQEPIGEYKKYIIYIKDYVKLIQENKIKKNYTFNEFKALVDNSIKKIYNNSSLYTDSFIYNNNYNNSKEISQKSSDKDIKSKKNFKDKNLKRKNPIKRSNTSLRKINQKNLKLKSNKDINDNKKKINIPLSEKKLNLQNLGFSQSKFIKLSKK